MAKKKEQKEKKDQKEQKKQKIIEKNKKRVEEGVMLNLYGE